MSDARLQAIKDAVRSGGYERQADGSFTKIKSVASKAAEPTPGKRLRQDKPMNKLEREWFTVLQNQTRPIENLRAQAMRFRLSNGGWYKPDATGVVAGQLTAWETKGPHAFRGGFENIKMAATQFPEWRWLLVWKERGEWRQQEVLP